MKFCKHCGKALDEQANFCPYCMNRQQEATPAPQIIIKKKFPKPLLFILPGIVAAAIIAGLLLWFPPRQSNAPARETQSSAYDLKEQFGELLGQDFDAVKGFFGTEQSPSSIDDFTGLVTHNFDDIELDVHPTNGKIYAYTVYYTLSDPPHRYNYRGIDGSATYRDVVDLLGLPSDDSGYPFEVTYAMEQGYLRIFFDEDLTVSKLFALFPYE